MEIQSFACSNSFGGLSTLSRMKPKPLSSYDLRCPLQRILMRSVTLNPVLSSSIIQQTVWLVLR